MDETKICPGYEVPVLDEEKNDNYFTVEAAVNEHNQTAQPGEKYWGISLENEKYTVYEYGEVPTPPTEKEQMETLRAKKMEEASDACEAAITAGIDVLLGDGTQEHFSLEVPDQSNIDGVFNAVMLGATAYPYHADGKQCKLYSAADIVTLYTAKQSTITQQTTYNNALRQWIGRETSLEVLKGISYGVELPEDLKAEVADILQKAKEQVEAIAKKLTTTVSA
mgnify:FL=1